MGSITQDVVNALGPMIKDAGFDIARETAKRTMVALMEYSEKETKVVNLYEKDGPHWHRLFKAKEEATLRGYTRETRVAILEVMRGGIISVSDEPCGCFAGIPHYKLLCGEREIAICPYIIYMRASILKRQMYGEELNPLTLDKLKNLARRNQC